MLPSLELTLCTCLLILYFCEASDFDSEQDSNLDSSGCFNFQIRDLKWDVLLSFRANTNVQWSNDKCYWCGFEVPRILISALCTFIARGVSFVEKWMKVSRLILKRGSFHGWDFRAMNRSYEWNYKLTTSVEHVISSYLCLNIGRKLMEWKGKASLMSSV